MKCDELTQRDPEERQVVWMPKTPEGELLFGYANTIREIARKGFVDHCPLPWKRYYRKGYRVVRVELREVA